MKSFASLRMSRPLLVCGAAVLCGSTAFGLASPFGAVATAPDGLAPELANAMAFLDNARLASAAARGYPDSIDAVFRGQAPR